MVQFFFFVPFILTLMFLTTKLNFMVKGLTIPEEQNLVGSTMLKARVESTTKDWFHVRMNPDWPIELLQERGRDPYQHIPRPTAIKPDPYHHLPPSHPLSHASIKCMTYSTCAALGGGTSPVANAACTAHNSQTNSCGDISGCQSEDGKCESGYALYCPYSGKCPNCCVTRIHS